MGIRSPCARITLSLRPLRRCLAVKMLALRKLPMVHLAPVLDRCRLPPIGGDPPSPHVSEPSAGPYGYIQNVSAPPASTPGHFPPAYERKSHPLTCPSLRAARPNPLPTWLHLRPRRQDIFSKITLSLMTSSSGGRDLEK